MQRFFSECGVEGVEVDQCVRGDSVEGQSASRMIHIDSDSTRDKSGGGKDIGGGDEGGGGGGGGGDIHISLLVPEKVTAIRAEETPGLVIVAQQTQRAFSLSTDAPVGHPNGELPTPLDLPVEATSGQGLSAQHLGKAVKSLCVVSVGLQVPGANDFSVVFRDV